MIAGGTSTYDIYVRTLDSDSDGTVDTEDCEPYDPSIYPGAPEIKHDAIDQDCNGYDLTIDITKSRYTPAKKNSPDSLEVWASSDLDGSAALTLEGYGAMTWTGNRWEIYIEPAGGDPGTVSVT
ncbi:MAG: hypothetical protein GWN77_01405, partial [Gammaproteobacteria bacterium]|nr:hypothetical protein [Gammaproteobacteria bacterium]